LKLCDLYEVIYGKDKAIQKWIRILIIEYYMWYVV
jgi:hypothetical protein